MRRRIRFLILPAAVLLVFLSGPRMRPERAATVPTDLPRTVGEVSSWIENREGSFTDLVPGTERRVEWAGRPGKRTDTALVYLHGFSASAPELSPAPERIADELGANLFFQRYTGHGRSGEALAEAHVDDWRRDTLEALALGRILGERVVLMGTSTGASLALLVAAGTANGPNPPLAPPDALVLVSPNLGPANPAAGIALLPWGAQLMRLAAGPERSWVADSPEHDRYWTNRYPIRALVPMMVTVRLTRRVDLEQVTMPMLVVYSPEDQVVRPRRTERFFASLEPPAQQLQPFRPANVPGQHVLAGDILAPAGTDGLVDLVVSFLSVQ